MRISDIKKKNLEFPESEQSIFLPENIKALPYPRPEH